MDDWEKNRIKRIIKKIFIIALVVLLFIAFFKFAKWYCGGTYQLKYFLLGSFFTSILLFLMLYLLEYLE